MFIMIKSPTYCSIGSARLAPFPWSTIRWAGREPVADVEILLGVAEIHHRVTVRARTIGSMSESARKLPRATDPGWVTPRSFATAACVFPRARAWTRR